MKKEVDVDPKVAKRMLAVEDPVEMKTEPGTEILIGTDDEEEMEGHWDRDHDHRATENYRRRVDGHVLGVGEVTRRKG